MIHVVRGGMALVIFFDVEAFGGGANGSVIIQMSAVARSHIKNCMLIYNRYLCEENDKKIYEKQRSAQKTSMAKSVFSATEKITFREAFFKFLEYTRACMNIEHKNHAIIVAHNGNVFDFIVLYNEMRQCGIDPNIFNDNNIYFIDSLDIFRRFVNNNRSSHQCTNASHDYKLGSVYSSIFGKPLINQHNSLHDAQALFDIFNNERLAEIYKIFDVVKIRFTDIPSISDRIKKSVEPWSVRARFSNKKQLANYSLSEKGGMPTEAVRGVENIVRRIYQTHTHDTIIEYLIKNGPKALISYIKHMSPSASRIAIEYFVYKYCCFYKKISEQIQ